MVVCFLGLREGFWYVVLSKSVCEKTSYVCLSRTVSRSLVLILYEEIKYSVCVMSYSDSIYDKLELLHGSHHLALFRFE